MCGIAGVVAAEAARLQPALQRMVQALAHRGPDGSNVDAFNNCLLGHTRLSIVDLVTGNQPMRGVGTSVAITFNGEIYGYKEIRLRLSEYAFQTCSDTEVILALYDRYGVDLLSHLPGMFAFALWDERRQRLFAARDRFGEKPFYYAWGRQGEFLFASEIKSLLISELFTPVISKAALSHYLQHLYIHPNETIYSNVFVLPPAHSLTLKGGQVEIKRYWELPRICNSINEDDAIEEFHERFEAAVTRQLVADVPVAAFLSGGLDSSSVVAVASKQTKLKTLAFGFGEGINELPYAREIAQLYGTDHVELEDNGFNIADLLMTMASVYDEPLADSSNIPTYLIAQAARHHSKVVLTGDGGDELLAGYDFWYRPLWCMEKTHSRALRVFQLMRVINKLLSSFNLSSRLPGWHCLFTGTALREKFRTIPVAHNSQNLYFGDSELSALGIEAAIPSPVVPDTGIESGTVDDALRMDLRSYMPGDILAKIDRASMAHGLELRAPFLDVDFASFCISLPSRLKITSSQDKWILRQAYGSDWTHAVRQRSKQGFGAPITRWLKLDSVTQLRRSVLHDSQHPLFSLIDFKNSRAIVTQSNYQTWALLVLGLWLEHAGTKAYVS